MEQNKIEKQFKEQLNSREIKPSEMAWDRLDAMLTVAEEKKPKRNYSWIYIAASFVGFLLIGTLFFNQNGSKIENQKDEIVIEESISTKSHKEPSVILNPNPESNKSVVTDKVSEIATVDNKKSVLKKDSLTKKENLNQNSFAEVSIINQKKESESISKPVKALTVDELLANVNQSRRLSNKSNPNLEVKVNPNQLLQQVDNDLEPTFRQSVFSRVADNIKIVKDAVVNRNQE